MTTAELISTLIAFLQLALALAIVDHLRRRRRALSWLTLLLTFFVIRAVTRLVEAFRGVDSPAYLIAADAVVLALLTVLLVGITRMMRALDAGEALAQQRQDEYERALHDYRVLMRHRAANPLAAIRGGVQTLRELRPLAHTDRSRLLAFIDEEARRLEKIVLDPHPRRLEERALDPQPHVPGRTNYR